MMMFLKLRLDLVLASAVVRGLLETPGRSLEINGHDANDSILPTLQPIQHTTTASLLHIAFYDEEPRDGQTVVLMHGFPAEQAALGYDLLTLMDALGIAHAILAGFDWGTIPVNVVAALWPGRCDGMVAVGSHLIQGRNTAWVPSDPNSEAARWYFYLFLTPRGSAALEQQLRALTQTIWAKNSPRWNFSTAELNRTLPALHNPDFINITVDFYKNRLLFAPGDPAYARLADVLDKQPSISVPSVTLDPEFSTTFPPTNGSATAKYFTGTRVHHIVPGAGENIPQQSPDAFVDAILEVDSLSKTTS
ncbi:hypothetical protein LA080_009207 [Diaporthe eres]|nr:hypothetical protein LA080_009207 [Diaporthe eres]